MSQPTATEEEELPPLPAIFEHCCTVYKRMEEEAQLVTLVTPDGQVEELVWSGHLTKLIAELRFSVPYYTTITRELKRMGCIAQKRRGGGNAPSQWLVLTAPTEEMFRSDFNKSSGISRKRATKVAMLEQRVAEHDKILNKISSDYDTIIDILQEREGK